MKQFKLVQFLMVVSFLCVTTLSIAQTDTARITGSVTDPSNAAVVGATVSITNQGTAHVVKVQTGANGAFTVSALPPGRYHAEAKQQNFKTATADFTLQVSQVQEINFKLQPGNIETVINVSDEVPLVETNVSSTGAVIQGRQVTELPLNGRNFTQLALLTPGVTRGYYGDVSMGGTGGTNAEAFRNSETGGASISANGLRQQANNFVLDGVDNNESLVNSIVFFPPAEAIQEFRVNTSVAPAEFGRAGGAIVQTSIKSGTNSIHGSAFEFRRSGDLDAIPYGYTKKPPFKRNQFGGTLGGPIWKDKLFAFGDYQGLRQSAPQNVELATVPTVKMRTGDFSELLGTTLPSVPSCASGNPAFVGKGYIFDPRTCTPFGWNGTTATNIIPANMLNAAALKYLNAFPAANIGGTIQQNYRAQRQAIRNFNDFDIRLDWIATQKDTLFARYSYGQDNFTVTPRLPTLPSGYGSGDNFNHPRGVAAGFTHSFNGNLVNEFRFGFTRPSFGYNPPFQSTPVSANLGIVNANRTPLLGGGALIGGWNSQIEYTGDGGPYVVPQHAYQYLDSLSWNTGKHAIKVGFNVIRRQVEFFQGNNSKGYFYIGDGTGSTTGYEVSELLSGFIGRYDIGSSQGYYNTHNWETGYFVQDDWRVNNRLTLNLGLRYDLYTWPEEANNRQSNFDMASGKLILAGTQGRSGSLINTDKNNFAPRIGFAYDLLGTGKTVVRGGYGMFFFLDRGGVGNQLSNNPDFNGIGSYSYANGYRITFTGMAPLNSNDPSLATAALPAPSVSVDRNNPKNVAVISYPADSQNSSVQQWNIQVEQQIGANNSVEVAYVGTKMSHLATSYNANLGAYGTGVKKYPNLGSVNVYGFVGSGNYNGLQTRFNRRLTKGLQLTASYTWSHTLDNSNGAFSPSGSGGIYVDSNGNPLLDMNYGNSDTDIRHFFTFSSIYELPFGKGRMFASDVPKVLDYIIGGWQWNNIVTIGTGTPFNVTMGNSGDGTTTVRPNVSSYTVDSGNNTWLSGNFTKPAANTQGNLPRNFFHGPGLKTWDVSLFKDFTVTERVKTQFRLEGFNLTNTPQFRNPNGDITNTTAFGKLGTQSGTRLSSERQMQLALRLTF